MCLYCGKVYLKTSLSMEPRGARCLWLCQHTVNEPFQPEQTYIYWQGQNNSNTVVHVYSRGTEEYQHQSKSFNNRTKIFPDLLSSGNFSLIIEPLMLKDDQTSLEVVFMQGNKEREKPCQLTLYVAVPFQEPETEINQANMTATCRTKGGYPKPEIEWSSGDGRTILEVQTKMTSEEDGTYSVSSTADITGLQKVTCRVYNPTLNQTLSASKDMTSSITPFTGTVVYCIHSN
uniref:Ig-like domain-containing protein n=1 Tax=Lates calcarifer TaxID=8187 RepID=A0A4W6E1Q9_LATCA